MEIEHLRSGQQFFEPPMSTRSLCSWHLLLWFNHLPHQWVENLDLFNEKFIKYTKEKKSQLPVHIICLSKWLCLIYVSCNSIETCMQYSYKILYSILELIEHFCVVYHYSKNSDSPVKTHKGNLGWNWLLDLIMNKTNNIVYLFTLTSYKY